ncbi:MAG: DUF4276 family protein [Lachnospiraceae bacterium]|nr:DUF4276 family protein [Lachnospiraceae bacterium]
MIVFLLEERSMEALLDELLPRIIPGEDYRLIPHEGKQDLIKSIPHKLRAWNVPNSKFVIVHDQDSNDCLALKSKILEICKTCQKDVLVRIPCHELEAWYFGDLQAVEKAYNINLKRLMRNKKYENPDAIVNPKTIIKQYVPGLTQIDGARRIGKNMDIENNKSYSFNVFVSGVRGIVGDA